MNGAPAPTIERFPQGMPPAEVHGLAPLPGQHDQNIGTAGVYRSANAQAPETEAHFTGDLPETHERRERATIAVGLGNVAARGVAMAPEESYAEEFKAFRGHFYNTHMAYLDQMRQQGEYYARRPQSSEDDEEDADSPTDDQAADIFAKARVKGQGPARHNTLHNNPN